MNQVTVNFSWRKRLQSIRYAFAGIRRFFTIEHNARIHLISTIIVFLASLFFSINKTELMLLIIVVSLVWITELLNTCMEKAMDFMTTETRPEIKFIKDLSAGAVLVAACTALIVGCLIFLPKIFL